MRSLCRTTPIPIALDEELIGIRTRDEKRKLLDSIQPQYIILKPTLVGGFAESQEWIKAASERSIGWWITSALESNIGLNTIAQWTYSLDSKLPQGLGTGRLFTNNFDSPLYMKSEKLFFDPKFGLFPSPIKTKSPKTTSEKQLYHFMREWENDLPSIVAHTSGTTGTPKEIRIEKAKMLHSALMTLGFLKIQPNDTALLCLSCEHIAGKMMVIRSITGLLNLLPVEPSANPLKNVADDQEIHFAAFVPLQVKEILRHPGSVRKLAKIKNVLIGGAPLPPELRTKLAKFKNNIYETYGMTETISHIALRKLSGSKQGNYFETLPGIHVSKDKRNCLLIHVPSLSAETIVTNDVVELKDRHHFKWLGRFDNMVNSGGIKLIPELLEAKIKSLIPQRFFFAGIPDGRLGEKLVLAIEGDPLSKKMLLQLKRRLVLHLKKYELPKEILFLPQFSESSAGKIIRRLNQ
jgi:acyl-CoA synthetase (AMP-forming)/AMP-acid ligase II